jgi:adenylate kinase
VNVQRIEALGAAMKTKCAVILFGPPGSGKTTEVRSLNVNRHIAVIETGNLLEREVRLGTPVGQRIKLDKAAGNLVPTDMVKDVVLAELKRVEGEVVLFDGFPRHLEQVAVFFQLLKLRRLKLCSVLVLTLNLQIAIQRIAGRRLCPGCGTLYNLHTNPPKFASKCDICGRKLRQRPDDRPEIVRHRFRTYQRETVPVIEFLKCKHAGLFCEESAAAPIGEVGSRLSERLGRGIEGKRNAQGAKRKIVE